MAVSGSTNFELDVADYIEEAFERCGLEVRNGYDLKTAKRSMNLMFAEWANRGLNQWTIEQRTQVVTQGTAAYSMGTDVIDVLSMVVRQGSGASQADINMSRISRDAFLSIPNKNTQARPSQFFIDRQITPEINVWPTPSNSTDTLVFDVLTRLDDADKTTNTVFVPFRFYPCLAAGLAYYLAIKKAPDKVTMLKSFYEEELARALSEDRDRASFNISPSLQNYRIG
jgi:hypothetical protein